MRLEQCSGTYNQVQMVVPLLQPLRLWTPRKERVSTPAAVSKRPVSSLPVGFSMRGGFVSGAGGERRLVIAGSIRKKISTV